MNRFEAMNIIFKEARRLIEKEHVNELIATGRYDKLMKIEVVIDKRVVRFLKRENVLLLKGSTVLEDYYFAVAMSIRAYAKKSYCDDLDFFRNKKEREKFAHNLAKQQGDICKSVAWSMLSSYFLAEMPDEEFFTASNVNCYDEEFGGESN